ncbi:hypothetical protein C8R47DRAFT_1057754 [Mycena vitilis]|nr:hypothetical protein C8R47DRAFT_1057754 [Mycena vitilis]
MTAGQPHPDTIPAAPAAPSKPRKPRRVEYKSPELDAILPNNTVPRFALVALVVREALNIHRGEPAGNIGLRRILLGGHATSATISGSVRNPDHFDPRREFNQYTVLFRAHLTPARLAEPVGLSNALAWFGTGQGADTRAFLNGLLPQGGFFKTDVSQMIQQFEDAMSQNTMNPDSVRYDNSRAWGNRPNPHLLAQPTKRPAKEVYTLAEKFGPMFDESVQTRWTKHLGCVANQDPETFNPEELPTWSSTVQLVSDLEIPAFKTGLTAMQLVNTLVFAKVVQSPTLQEMAEWVSRNPKLGAAKGLDFLGFRARTANEIRASYICFHNFLEKHLSLADRINLGFHPPCTEHLLCKVPRLDEQLNGDKSETLQELAAKLDDSVLLPLPLNPTRDALEVALKNGDAEATLVSESLEGNGLL